MISGIGSVGRALALGARGREFESRIPDQKMFRNYARHFLCPIIIYLC